LLRQLDPGIADLKARADEAAERLSTSSATRQSKNGSVSVTVGPGGNLMGLNLNEQAYEQPPAKLAAEIMRLAGQAQQQVSADVAAAFSGLVGPNSPAMDVLSPFLRKEEGTDDRPATSESTDERDNDERELW
jgi:DNA-binding protein YbaB